MIIIIIIILISIAIVTKLIIWFKKKYNNNNSVGIENATRCYPGIYSAQRLISNGPNGMLFFVVRLCCLFDVFVCMFM